MKTLEQIKSEVTTAFHSIFGSVDYDDSEMGYLPENVEHAEALITAIGVPIARDLFLIWQDAPQPLPQFDPLHPGSPPSVHVDVGQIEMPQYISIKTVSEVIFNQES